MLEPFKRLIDADQLMAYKHEGFWRSMDTLRDRQMLEDMVEKGDMPWAVQPEAAPKPAVSCGSRGNEGAAACPSGRDTVGSVPRRAFRRHRDRRAVAGAEYRAPDGSVEAFHGRKIAVQ